MSPPPNRHWLPATLIFLVCAAAYFLTRTPALDEWDSVQFAMGVGDFNLWRHHPHPPGYPLYIASGWLAHHLLPLDVPNALQLVSALGGGLFVACWFVLIARSFGRATAWWCTASLATLLITWMTATKVLTDPAGAGLFALMILLADTGRRREGSQPAVAPATDRWLAATAAVGAVDAGVRPQNTGVILLVLLLTIIAVRRPFMRRRWVTGFGVFLGVGLLWLLPTMVSQAETPEGAGNLLAYPRLLLAQWRWRLNQPKAFVGAASPGGESLWLYRVDHHLLGWLTRGFGFPLDSIWGWLGVLMLVTGGTLYVLELRRVRGTPSSGNEPSFWAQHLPWAILYVVTVFCCLPGDQRYYLPVFPLLILPAVLGWQSLRWHEREHGRWLAAFVPAATLLASLPFIGPNHTEAAPPVRMMRWLQTQYPPAERPHIRLILRDDMRHAQWYAPDFLVLPAEEVARTNPAQWPPDTAQGACYTDDPAIVARFPVPGWRLVQVFQRSPLIYRKHNMAALYRLKADGH